MMLTICTKGQRSNMHEARPGKFKFLLYFTPIGEFTVPTKRFQHWNIDIVTLPISNGYRHLLTAVDRFTRWPLAIPMTDMTADSVIDAFTHGLIATFGVPESVTTDNGRQFTGSV